MKPMISILGVAVTSVFLAGCATSLGTKTSEAESLKAQVASLEGRVGELNSKVEDLSKQQGLSEGEAQATPTAASEKESGKGSAALSARQVQLALKNAGFYSGQIDGRLGRKTKQAVKAFQRSNGLTPDGKIGARTSMALAKFIEKEK
ncbi:MAG: peptidoglycan-binding protein [Candidatus Omnitrophica bacterium]|nr:peptidoglycan-binding protein [Candidatus Omnitrophota bacterium]